MCGIAGILNYAQRATVSRDCLAAMRGAMRQRGPDESGELLRPARGVGLTHVRLSIIDLSGGHQPLCNEDGTVWTVFNGEIYNFAELRAELEAAGHVFRTRCDTEVLVHLYEDHGAEMPSRLLGDFAFAIWDERDGTLLLARDHMGVKPLYYCDHGGSLAFASTLPALLAGAAVPRDFNPIALQSYLAFSVIQAPHTVYRHVHKLLPGQTLVLRHGRVSLHTYWSLRLEPDAGRSHADLIEELDSLVQDAVRRQMMADVPLGAFLSGGVDSSLVVQSMRAQSNGPVKAFSIAYREPRYDESPHFRRLAEEMGVEHHELTFQSDRLEDITEVIDHFGEPCALGSAFPLYYLSRLARQHVKVVLSGDGPDEIFAGYDIRYRHLARIRRASRVPQKLLEGMAWLAKLTAIAPTTSSLGNAGRRMRKLFDAARCAPENWLPLLAFGGPPGTTVDGLLSQRNGHSGVLPFVDSFRAQGERDHWLQPFLYADIRVMLPDEMFTKVDCMTMAHGLEGRVPLSDYRIAELAARLPTALKYDGHVGKLIYRRVAQRRLPAWVLGRRKTGFRVPLNEWLRGPLYPLAADLLTGATFSAAGIFNTGAVARLLELHRSAKAQLGNLIWRLVVFELWRRRVHCAVSPPAP